jgi:hypothetical protein
VATKVQFHFFIAQALVLSSSTIERYVPFPAVGSLDGMNDPINQTMITVS